LLLLLDVECDALVGQSGLLLLGLGERAAVVLVDALLRGRDLFALRGGRGGVVGPELPLGRVPGRRGLGDAPALLGASRGPRADRLYGGSIVAVGSLEPRFEVAVQLGEFELG